MSAELALRFLRGNRSAKTILRIRGQLKSVLRRLRVTKAEFLLVISTFATGLDYIKNRETLCQIVY
jgi:hypothetical protein